MMNLIFRLMNKSVVANLLLAFTMVFVTAAFAGSVPYPGKIPVKVVRVDAANIVAVSFEAWPGYPRVVRIFLPNLETPAQGQNPEQCEYELAQMAYEFTVNFLENAKDISVNDMWMENSASEDAISSILTRNGSLDEALIRERLARPINATQNQPWC